MKASSHVLHHMHFPGESAEYRAARSGPVSIAMSSNSSNAFIALSTVSGADGSG